jgi:hypothetical protein
MRVLATLIRSLLEGLSNDRFRFPIIQSRWSALHDDVAAYPP